MHFPKLLPLLLLLLPSLCVAEDDIGIPIYTFEDGTRSGWKCTGQCNAQNPLVFSSNRSVGHQGYWYISSADNAAQRPCDSPKNDGSGERSIVSPSFTIPVNATRLSFRVGGKCTSGCIVALVAVGDKHTYAGFHTPMRQHFWNVTKDLADGEKYVEIQIRDGSSNGYITFDDLRYYNEKPSIECKAELKVRISHETKKGYFCMKSQTYNSNMIVSNGVRMACKEYEEGCYKDVCNEGYRFNGSRDGCVDIDECQHDNGCCHHICNNTAGSYECSCRQGYKLNDNGTKCTDIDECTSNTSNCQHNCTNTNGSYNCSSCRPGYKPYINGPCHDIDECTSNTSLCEHNCHNTNGGYNCSCRPGYKFYMNGSCHDINECTSNTSNCQHNCRNTNGSYNCSICRPGYELYRSVPCHDIDECTSNTSNCTHNCHNTNGGYNCSCRSGYKLYMNGSCHDIDECTSNTSNCQHNCHNTNGGYSCSCRPGYKLYMGGSDHDIDKCTINIKNCRHNCHNPIGGYDCSCKPRYKPYINGSCHDIDECTSNTSNCQHNCHNTNGGYNCSCRPGYQLYMNGSCQDIDECTSNTSLCEHKCTNTNGSYNCSCRPGYKLYMNVSCHDIDECTSNTGNCQHNCHNTNGGYNCSCRPGYKLYMNGSCHDIDECTSNTNLCEHNCTNTNGSYSCSSCRPGYKLYKNGSCHDIDECTSNTSLCEHNCHNTNGNYNCSCRPGYKLYKNGSCHDIDECTSNTSNCTHNCHNTNGGYNCSCRPGYELYNGLSCKINWTATIAGITVGCFLFFVSCFAACFVVKKKRREGGERKPRPTIQVLDKWEILPKNMTLLEELGEGAFGKVLKATLERMVVSRGLTCEVITVAVKTLHDESTLEDKILFQKEINLMKRIGKHRNIVNMIGCVTLSEPMQLILEYVPHGNLLEWLRKRRSKNLHSYYNVQNNDDDRIRPASRLFGDCNKVDRTALQVVVDIDQKDASCTDDTNNADDSNTGDVAASVADADNGNRSNAESDSSMRSTDTCDNGAQGDYTDANKDDDVISALLSCDVSGNRSEVCDLCAMVGSQASSPVAYWNVDKFSGEDSACSVLELDRNETDHEIVSFPDMLSIAWQISRGMEYMSARGFVHRDLAARNILVGDDRIIKITDFGMTRSPSEEIYLIRNKSKIPTKWMPPETLRELVFTTKSDVWSFGVLLWEITTFGTMPYTGVDNRDVSRLIRSGYRLEKPEMCSDGLYDVMRHCWKESPAERPSFTVIREKLETMMQKEKPYVDLVAAECGDRTDDNDSREKRL